jgi:hypothetical protein
MAKGPARSGGLKNEFPKIKVRGIDQSGKVQEPGSLIGRIIGRTFPDGGRGIHAVEVTVKKS